MARDRTHDVNEEIGDIQDYTRRTSREIDQFGGALYRNDPNNPATQEITQAPTPGYKKGTSRVPTVHELADKLHPHKPGK